MIISCPACATRYAVPDTSIGVDGRTVRCAKCRHSWFQDGPELVLRTPPAPAAFAPTPPAPLPTAPPKNSPSWGHYDDAADSEPVAAPSPITAPNIDYDQRDPPLSEAVPAPRIYADAHDSASVGPSHSSFEYEPPFRPRKNPARIAMIASIGFAMVAFAAIGAVAWFGLPKWVPFAHSNFAEAPADLVLDFPHNRQERRTLADGTDFFNVSGTIRNIGKQTRNVPNLRIVLRDSRGRLVRSLEVASPRPTLAPGESEAIDQAIIDTPKSARAAEIGWKAQ